MKDRNGRITQWLIILRDITDRKRLEKEILEISDREQRRLGQDLHDGLCQELAGIELMSQALEQKIAGRSRSDAARAGEIAGHVREAIRQTRLLARGLSPLMLESEGLMSALQELALNTGKMFRVDCRFECGASVLVRDQATATHLFRIAQEAVSNALKHGKAEQITIRLGQQGGGPIRLVIEDSGPGFPDPLPAGRGMGLRIMESRAGMIGGTLATGNRPQGGARVACEVLIAQQKQTSEHRVRKTKTNKSPQPGPDH
jgi:signal transduction histidine kinase